MAIIKHIDFEAPAWGELTAGPQLQRGYLSEVLAEGEYGGPATGLFMLDGHPHDHLGRYSGQVLGGLTYAAGMLARCDAREARFDGLSRVLVATSDFSFPDRAAFSVEAWVRPTGSGAGPIADTVTAYWTDFGWTLIREANGMVTFNICDAGRTWALCDADAAPGTSRHYAATYDGQSMRGYRGGVLVASSACTRSMSSKPALAIGAGPTGSSYRLLGSIQALALYAHALTPARIQAHHRAGVTR